MAETVIYLDGDAADETFALLYHDGWPDGTAETLAHLAQWMTANHPNLTPYNTSTRTAPLKPAAT